MKKKTSNGQAGKTRAYLKYAIGEIILVVIGILVALSINNWNDLRKEQIKEQTILLQLKDDYQSNLLQLEEKMGMRKVIVHKATQILNAIDHPNLVQRDSLIHHLASIKMDPTFDPVQNDLISSGNLRLIRNKKLKKFFSNWTSDIVAVREMERIWTLFTHQQIQPRYMRLGITRELFNNYWDKETLVFLLDKDSSTETSSIGKSKVAASLKKLTSDRMIESIASHAINFNKIVNQQSKTLHKRITEILKLIDSELERTNN
jgi:hypothetical protein